MFTIRNQTQKSQPDEEPSLWESLTANSWSSIIMCVIILVVLGVMVALILPNQNLVAAAQANLISSVIAIVLVMSVGGLSLYVVIRVNSVAAMVKRIDRRLRDQSAASVKSLAEIAIEDLDETAEADEAAEVIEADAPDDDVGVIVAAADVPDDDIAVAEITADDSVMRNLADTQEISPAECRILQSITAEQMAADTQEIDTEGVRTLMREQAEFLPAVDFEPEEECLFLGQPITDIDEDLLLQEEAELDAETPAEAADWPAEEIPDSLHESADCLAENAEADSATAGQELAKIINLRQYRSPQERIELEAAEKGVPLAFLQQVLATAHAESYYELPAYYREMVDNASTGPNLSEYREA